MSKGITLLIWPFFKSRKHYQIHSYYYFIYMHFSYFLYSFLHTILFHWLQFHNLETEDIIPTFKKPIWLENIHFFVNLPPLGWGQAEIHEFTESIHTGKSSLGVLNRIHLPIRFMSHISSTKQTVNIKRQHQIMLEYFYVGHLGLRVFHSGPYSSLMLLFI